MAIPAQRPQPPASAAWPARRWWMLAGLSVLAALIIVWLAPAGVLFTSAGTDTTGQFAAWRAFAADSLRHGELPLWNPYTYAGQPFLGDFQSALLYPPNLIFLILPLERALNFSFLLHLLLLGWGMGFWIVRRGNHPAAAAACGFAAMLAGPVFPHLYAGHLSNVCAMAWAPWILCALEIAWRGKNLRALLLAAAAASLQILAGHAQYVFYTAIAAGLFAVASTFTEPAARRRALPFAAVAYAFAALLAAAQLLPGFAAASEGVRQGKLAYDFVRMFSFPPENLLTLVAPGFFGDMSGTYWGRAYLWEMSLFTGIAALVLALIAVADMSCRRRALTDGAVAALLFALALGDHTPMLRALYDFVPGFGQFRGLSKFTFPALLFGLLVAAAGADALLRHNRARTWLALGLTLCGVAAGTCGIYLWFHPGGLAGFLTFVDGTKESYLHSFNYTWPQFADNAGILAARALTVGGAVMCLLGAGLSLGARWPALRWLPLVVLPIEMACFAHANVATTKLDDAMLPDLRAFVANNRGDYRVFNPSWPNNGFLLGASDIWGANPAVLKRYAEFIAFTQDMAPESAGQYANIRNIPPSFSMLRLGYAFVPGPPGGPLLQVLKYPNPLPRALLVSDYRVLTGRDAIFAAIAEPGFDPRKTALLESEPAVNLRAGGESGTVRVVNSTANTVTIEADTPAPALLLVTDLYSKDWRARALPGNSQTAYELLPANYILRAIPLAAGHHNLVLEYAPPSFRLGVVVSSLSWLAWMAIFARMRRRTHPHESAP